ncbi:MAG: mannosyltransferase [Deltaproteobacteria bacterium]|jgi:glycosyltransferase involved in cell wall biosynthesis|nr:mannosyltransferase [Deltaproteobacteria bacterium]
MTTASSVLVTTYPEAFLHKGGGEYELLEIVFNLRKTGLIADVYGPFSRDIENYDTILHFSLESGGLPLLERARGLEKRIVLWPNFWLAESPSGELANLIRRFFALADAVVFKSQIEQDMLQALIPKACRIVRVPTGVDPCFALPAPERLFRDSYSLTEYLLWVGIIEPGKNQLQAIRALRSLDLPLVFIGNYRDRGYYDLCRRTAPEHFIFLDPMPYKSDMLRAALRECRLYIELASEPGGKSVLEAVISGAGVVLPESAWGREHFGDFPVYVDPENDSSILEGIERGLRLKRDPAFASAVAARHAFPGVLRSLCGYLNEER